MQYNLSSWHIWKQSWIQRSPCGNVIHVPIRSFEILSMLSWCRRVKRCLWKTAECFSSIWIKITAYSSGPDLPEICPRTLCDRPSLACVGGAWGGYTYINRRSEQMWQNLFLFCFFPCCGVSLWGGAWLWGGWQLVKPRSHKFRFSTRVCVCHRGACEHAISGGDYRNC